ncbi:MAG: hypothetical protein IPI50_07295 [Saprospiraceae bacterium]|nr:hypothetical protein [Saprospiraceae bacterium]
MFTFSHFHINPFFLHLHMQKFPALLMCIIMALSCQPKTDYQAKVNQLSAEWITANAQFQETKSKVQNNLQTMRSLLPNINLNTEAFYKRNISEQNFLKEMKNAFDTQINGLTNVHQQVLEFETKWTAHYKMLNEIQAEIQTKTESEDLDQKIQKVENILLENPSLLVAWNRNAEGSLTTAMTAYQHIFQIQKPQN